MSSREALVRRMVADGEFQVEMTAPRRPAQLEAEWMADHTCRCHGWYPDWRCHDIRMSDAGN